MAKRTGLGRGLDGMIPRRSIHEADKNPEEISEKHSETEASSEDTSVFQKTDKTSKSSKPGRSVKTDRTVKSEKTGKAGKTGGCNTGGSGKSGSTEKKSRSVNPGRTVNPDETLVDGKSEDGKKISLLKISDIEPNENQPRKNFDKDSLEQLAESIRQHGIIQPIVVHKKENHYEIIAGERRWRAARMAGMKEVPAIIQDFSEREVMEISLIENIQRETLNPVEEARAFERLIDEFGLTQDELAEKVSRNRTTITNSLRLLKLSPDVLDMLAEGKISSGHARALLSVEDPEKQLMLARRISDEQLSVREVEKMVKDLQKPRKEAKKEPQEDEALSLIYRDMEDHMKEALGTKVRVNRRDNNRGRIEIEYYSGEELERIYDILRHLS